MIGRYRVIALLGEGGQARVFLALSKGPAGFQKLLVVKMMREDLEDPIFIQSFLQEARLAAQLNHPNVVQTYEVGEDDGRYFIAMEYVQGQSLGAIQRRLSPESLPLTMQLRILAETARGLHHAHTLKSYDGTPLDIVHRDVSPQNVMISYDGQVKLLDFGIAKAAGGEGLTREGMLKGKIAYMPPEQLRGDTLDHRADIFPLGVMMWQAITGKRLAGANVPELQRITNRMSGNEPKLRDVAPDTPVRLVEICERALALEPTDRQATAEQFAQEIYEYLSDTSAATDPRLLGELIEPLFERERREMQVLVDQQIRLANSAETTDVAIARLPRVSDSEQISSFSPEQRALSDEARDAVRTDARTRPEPHRRRASPMLAIGVILAAGTGALGLALALTAGSAPDASTELPTAPSSASAPSDVAPAARIRVHISAQPETARAELDGASIALPFDVALSPDAALHVLTVQAEGHVTERRALAFDRDLELAVALQAAPDDAPVAQEDERGRRPSRPVRAPIVRAETPSAPPAAPPVAQPQAQPASDDDGSILVAPRRRLPTIDTDDPYATP
ncbi:serine/threonine-protein kinase [Sandaracinus amylolyticus]|uniref:serine/threonine-protein kinase n=1 Tax=Sandaracinus amylolyticus TaxID=927083 RepID=UPI001F407995|nr:serine/threonine-protein kinase [Sandaracinus amylolyticus]